MSVIEETARRIIRTWERGLITLSEMVEGLETLSALRDNQLLGAGAELAERRREKKG